MGLETAVGEVDPPVWRQGGQDVGFFRYGYEVAYVVD